MCWARDHRLAQSDLHYFLALSFPFPTHNFMSDNSWLTLPSFTIIQTFTFFKLFLKSNYRYFQISATISNSMRSIIVNLSKWAKVDLNFESRLACGVWELVNKLSFHYRKVKVCNVVHIKLLYVSYNVKVFDLPKRLLHPKGKKFKCV